MVLHTDKYRQEEQIVEEDKDKVKIVKSTPSSEYRK